MGTWVRTAAAMLVALLVLTGWGYNPAHAASSASVPAQLSSIAAHLGQQAAAAARRAALSGRQTDGTLQLSFRAYARPIVVRATVETLAAEVNAQAASMIRRYVDDLSLRDAVLVVKSACLFKFGVDFYGESNAIKRVQMVITEFGGSAMLVPRAIGLGNDMYNAEGTSDKISTAAVGAACEAVGFVPSR